MWIVAHGLDSAALNIISLSFWGTFGHILFDGVLHRTKMILQKNDFMNKYISLRGLCFGFSSHMSSLVL